jgi:hypothetical protein
MDTYDERLLQFGNVISKAELETVATAQPHWTDDDEFLDIVIGALRQEFETGDRILKQRMGELEQQVMELRGQLSALIQKMTSVRAMRKIRITRVRPFIGLAPSPRAIKMIGFSKNPILWRS